MSRRKYTPHLTINALLYLTKNGCYWLLVPHAFPLFSIFRRCRSLRSPYAAPLASNSEAPPSMGVWMGPAGAGVGPPEPGWARAE